MGEVLTLKDGCRVGVAQWGPPEGAAVLYCHGFPGCRLEAALAARAAVRLGVRLVAVDRPGYALSDPLPDWDFRRWASFIGEVADSVGLDRFSVLGVSGGAPYALACAALLGDRISAVGVACGLAPVAGEIGAREMPLLSRIGLALGARSSSAVGLFFEMMWRMTGKDPRRLLNWMGAGLPAVDRTALKDAAVMETLGLSMREALRGGSAGVKADLALYGRPWGFPLSAITCPAFLWHGELDATVPPSMGRLLAAAVPGCTAHFFSEEGHFSLPVRRMDMMLGVLTGQLPDSSSRAS